MKTINVKLLTVMTSMILMMGIAPAAFGQATTETHAYDIFPLGPQPPNTPFQFQSVNTLVGPPSGVTIDIRTPAIYVYFSPTGTFPPLSIPLNLGAPEPDATVLAGQKTCSEALPDTAIGDMMWILFHSNDAAFTTTTQVQAEHKDIGFTSSTLWYDSIFPVGGPVLLNPGIPNQVGPVNGDGFGSGQPAIAGFDNANAFIVPALANPDEFYYWQKIDINGNPIAGSDSTAVQGTYVGVMCAYLDGSGQDEDGNPNSSPQDDDWGGLVVNANTGVANKGAENQNNVITQFFILAVVGGASMPISATSLLVAGAEANALWILPILGLAGMIIAIRKLQA